MDTAQRQHAATRGQLRRRYLQGQLYVVHALDHGIPVDVRVAKHVANGLEALRTVSASASDLHGTHAYLQIQGT